MEAAPKEDKMKEETKQSSVLPYLFDEKKVTSTISAAEKEAMKKDVELNIIVEPMDHFSNEDDTFLSNLLRENQSGSGANVVYVKSKMKGVAREVMEHWYNLHGADLDNYMDRFFDNKWKVLDNRNKGQIELEEGMKFIRDFISGMIQI